MTSAAHPEILQQFATRARRLYSLPTVALRVIELAREPELDARAMLDCIEADPAIAGKILRMANSSLFGVSQQVVNLNQAVGLLGLKTLRLLVLGFSLPQTLLTNVECQVLSRYWRQAVIKSVAAREISERIWHASGDEAFLAGLLQDIGMLALIQDLGSPYIEFLKRIFAEGGNVTELEQAALGFDHWELSREMLQYWGIPVSISQAVAWPPGRQFHAADAEEDPALVQVLHVAERVTEFLLQGRAAILHEVLDLGKHYRGPSYVQLESLMDALGTSVPQLLEVLACEPVEAQDYRGILLEAYQLLTDASDKSSRQAVAETVILSNLSQQAQDLSEAVRHFVGHDARELPPPAAAPSVSAAAAPARLAPTLVADMGESGLHQHLNAAIGRCRQARRAVSLLLAEVDHFDSVLLGCNDRNAEQLMRMLGTAIRKAIGGEGVLLELPPSRLAISLEAYDRQQAVELARQLVRAVSHWSVQHAPVAISLSVGLATLTMPTKNSRAPDLVDAAERCLHAVQCSGGDSVKSIDIY
jgi:HD-like signal output (HDOD) protein/GGDEF domain-containing protein